MKISKFENLVLNLLSGLKPQNLSREEVAVIESKIGDDWFEEMGFDESDGRYKRPTFD